MTFRESAAQSQSGGICDSNLIQGISSANEQVEDYSTVASGALVRTGAPSRIEYGDSSGQLQPASSSYYQIDVDVLFTPEASSGNFTGLLLPDRNPVDDFPLPFPSGSEEASNSISSTLGCIDPPHTSSLPSPEISIGDDWMLPLLPPADAAPPLARHSMEVLLRVLRTWPRILAKEFQLPPMIHPSQVAHRTLPQPLANCFTLCKMWAGHWDGASEMVRDTVLKEMKSLFERYQILDEASLLAALQALVMYTIILLFPSRVQTSVSSVDQSVFASLQKVVYHIVGTGLVLEEEKGHTRPTWEAWIHVTAKRRAILTLYLLHWSYSVYNCLPSFDCAELGFMPAPAPKVLWQASRKEQWETMYNRWLAQWNGNEYMMREFGAIEPGPVVNPRAELWLEDADELGILFFSIVNATEREQHFMVANDPSIQA